MTFEKWFTEQYPNIPQRALVPVLRLVADGSTVPFIARYRKEQTGNLDEVGIQTIIDANEQWESILHRQKHIVEEIERQGKLTQELKEKILGTFRMEELEDLYLPYKQKRKTKATIAKEAGLEPLADWIWNCGHGSETPQPGQTLELWAFTFRNEKQGINEAGDAISGAQDILVERLSEMGDLRQLVRSKTLETGFIRTKKGAKAKPHSKFENYFEYSEAVQSLLQPQNSHRYLAVRRGWMEEEITLSIGGKPDTAGGDGGFEEALLSAFETAACTQPDSPGTEVLKKAARLALKSYVQPSIENEVHKALREVADDVAIKVFSENVRKLLMASPFGSKAVMGVDPGIRTGCKVAVVDDSGKFIADSVIHLQTDDQKEQARKFVVEVVRGANIRAVAVGNGTAGRETESFVRSALKEAELSAIPVVMVSESGASVYSASEAAREEFPDLDVTVRGAISIARRLQDPLAELVKIDPKSIGVGQYQHDVSEYRLKKSLDNVVDSCVNQVGVNLNTASYHLLSHVAGIGPSLAKAMVEFRTTKGLFRSRKQLMEVARFSGKTFEQAAGFLRIPGGDDPLDNTGVHPERYPALENYAKDKGMTIRDLMGQGVAELKKNDKLRQELGEFTFQDVIKELEKPGRDPRETFVPFQYREDVHEIKDLKPGMICPGIVTNVTNFGAFVDIGVHQDGLVHLSQLSNHFVKDPKEVVSPGDRVQVRVLEVMIEKNQIALAMKGVEQQPGSKPNIRKAQAPAQPRKAAGNGPREGGPRDARKDPPRDFKSDSRRDNRKDFRGDSKAKGQPERRPPPKPKQAFNNAFAGLAALRDQLKSGKN